MTAGGFFEFHERVTRRRTPSAPDSAPEGASSDAPSQAGNPKRPAPAITVSQLTYRIERILKDAISETLYVRGEVSNFRPNHSSGHVYFTMKDATSCIDCVMWQSDVAKLKFTPNDGLEMLATGRLGVYVPKGKYQLYVSNLRPLGQGALELAFQQLRAKLEAEGLFATERKKELPAYPMRLVLVTSRQTAALQDMLKVLRRFPWLRVMLYHVPVQGDGASARIASAIAHLGRRGGSIGAEVLLLARGGGSLEDMWPFNEEIVARAMALCPIPIITGIGHEVDTSIADLVADYHAHTPTEAARIVTARWETVGGELADLNLRLTRATRNLLQDARHRLKSIERHEAFRRPLDRIRNFRQYLDEKQRALTQSVVARVDGERWRLREMEVRLERRLPADLVRLRQRLDQLDSELATAIAHRLRTAGERLAHASALLAECHPKYRLQLRHQKLGDLAERLPRAMQSSLEKHQQILSAVERHLNALGPSSVLRRGFTLTIRKKGGAILRSASEVRPGDRLITRFADGQVESIADDPKQLPLFE